MRSLRVLLLAFLCGGTFSPPCRAGDDSVPTGSSTVNISSRHSAVEKLTQAGVSPSFIDLLQSSADDSRRDKIIQYNVMGFLGKADYSGHYGPAALKSCRQVLKKYKQSFVSAEKKYGVPKEVLAALLWVETKHGRDLGTFNVLEVYFSLIQADRPEVITVTQSSLAERVPASETNPEQMQQYQKKVEERSQTKANWAMEEIKALEQIYNQQPSFVERLRGSFSGAFGIPQFLPSSYLTWAKTGKKNEKPNLFRMEDAIPSVGFYLQSNGWKSKDRTSQRAAIYHYNRADGYVDVILRIAKKISH